MSLRVIPMHSSGKLQYPPLSALSLCSCVKLITKRKYAFVCIHYVRLSPENHNPNLLDWNWPCTVHWSRLTVGELFIGISTGRTQWRLGGLGLSGHSCVLIFLPRLFKFIPTTLRLLIGQTCGNVFFHNNSVKKMMGELSIGCQKLCQLHKIKCHIEAKSAQ